jgi:hypothetical protein
MALIATHLRFALETKPDEVEDVTRYLSGVFYPDSRYITKCARQLTHDGKFLEKSFATDDFKKGWQNHLLCDKMQWEAMGDISCLDGKKIVQYDDIWIMITAIKIIQDISDSEEYSIAEHLPILFGYIEERDGKMELLQKYYKVVNDFYGMGRNRIPLDYKIIFTAFDIPECVQNAIMSSCENFQNDEIMMKKILGIYPKMIEKLRS